MGRLTKKESGKRVKFQSLSVGDTFEYKGSVYMKTSLMATYQNCVVLDGNLNSGEYAGVTTGFGDSILVKKVNVVFEVVN